MQIDLTHNFDRGVDEITDFFRRDVPFAITGAVNDVAFKVRTHIVEQVYPRSFTVRNKRFAGVMFRVDKRGATKRQMLAGGIEARVYQRDMPSRGGGSPLRGYMSRHVTGGAKSSVAGHEIAVPVEKNVRRLAGGAVRKADRPTQIRNKKKGAVVKGKRGQRLIIERNRDGTATTKFVLKRSVKIKPIFPFYREAKRVAMNDIDSAVYFAMRRAARSNRKVRMR